MINRYLLRKEKVVGNKIMLLCGLVSGRAQREEVWLVGSCHHLHSFLSWHCWGVSWGVVYVGMCRWNIWESIRLETLWLNCSTCLQMYHRKASLDQRPIIMIWQTEQSLRNIAMAAPDLIKCMPISDGLILADGYDRVFHGCNDLS